jgi:hypothetical protein
MRVDDPPSELAGLTRAWLDGSGRPDLLHFHTFGRSEEEVATLALERNIPFAFTYHSPFLDLPPRTLLRWGPYRVRWRSATSALFGLLAPGTTGRASLAGVAWVRWVPGWWVR